MTSVSTCCRQSGRAVLIALLGAGCGAGIYNEPSSECDIVDRHQWINSTLGGSTVERPYCPTLFTYNGDYSAYLIYVNVGDLSKVHAWPSGRVAFHDNQQALINFPWQNELFLFNGNTATVMGSFPMATDSIGPGVNQGTDYARIRVYLVNGDSARGEAFLTYRRRAGAYASGQTQGVVDQMLSFSVDATAEFRPVMYEWFVNDISQGAPAEHASTFATSFGSAGMHEVKVRVTPGHTIAPYSLPLAIEIDEAGGCGGEGQLPCTAPPGSGMSSTKAGRAPGSTAPR